MATRSMYEEQRLRERGLLPRASLGGTRLQRIPDADEDPSNDKFRAYVIDAERGEGREAEVSRGEASGLQALDPESMVLGDDEALVGPEQEALLAQAASARAKPQLSARAVALKELAEGRGGVGPALVASMGTERAALAGNRASPSGGFQGPSPELLADAERGVSDFQQGLRLKGGEVPVPRGSGNRLPSIQVAKPGGMPAPRAPVALHAPSGRPEPVPDAEGVASRTVPRDEEFAAAQDDSRMRALSAALSRAGARASEAISGVRGDAGVYDALDAQADSPVRELLARREADKRKALEDPTSEQSQRLRAYISKALPGVYSPEELANITAADADAVTRYGEMSQRLQQRAADKAAAAEALSARYAREDAVREDEQAFQRDEGAKNRAAMRARSSRPSERQVAASQALLERDVQKAGEDLEGAGTLSSDLNFLDRMAAQEDVPGVGKWDSRKTGLLSVFASDDDTRTMQTMRSVVGRLLKERSGTAASDSEVERVMTELGMGPGSSEQEFRVGLQRLRQDVGNALATKQARYRPEVIRTYQERGGTTAQDVAPRQGAPAQQADMVKMLDPQGRERMVPRAKVQAAIAAGGRVVNG